VADKPSEQGADEINTYITFTINCCKIHTFFLTIYNRPIVLAAMGNMEIISVLFGRHERTSGCFCDCILMINWLRAKRRFLCALYVLCTYWNFTRGFNICCAVALHSCTESDNKSIVSRKRGWCIHALSNCHP
jgi:hypothetical protein